MCADDVELTKLVFPSCWGRRISEADLRLRDDDIRAAFEYLCTNEEISRKYRVCLFIDGLDEFSSEEMALWKVAKMMRSWTQQAVDRTNTNGLIKLCVSSREDDTVMSVFEKSNQIRLQDITEADISIIVNDTLLGNEHFQELRRSDPHGCGQVLKSILVGAEGVFLRVSLLLNLLEDELPTVASASAPQNIIRTTPLEVEDFLGKILDTMRKHYRRGVYFLFAVALRMLGPSPRR